MFGGTNRRARARHLAIAHRTGISRTLAIALVAGLLAPLVVFATGAGSQEAAAVTYDAAAVPIKFTQASRVAVVGTGTAAGDIQKYVGAATIAGVKIDAVVRTVALTTVTVSKFDEGSAVTTAPPGSSLTTDDLFQPNLNGTGSESMVTFEFSFYENGTYTGIGTGVPVVLTHVAVNSYDVDGNGGVKQFTDFRGFQTYTTYSESSTKGLDISSRGNGIVRLLDRGGANVSATSGSYSFARVKVNYDQVTKLTARVGSLGTGVAYFALDFSAGGIWTTNGTTAVTPTTLPNPFNSAPVTQDISAFYAAQGTGYVFTSADFPYSDVDENPFTALKIVTPPAPTAGALEYRTVDGWVPVTPGQAFTTDDIDTGALRLVPTPSGGSFTFQVQDGLLFSNTGTLTYTAPANAQTITFPQPSAHAGSSSFPSGATASSGLAPTLTSQTPGVCTVAGTTVSTLALPTGVTSATCVIVATQAGDASYGRVQPVTVQFAVSSLPSQTITFPAPADRPFTTTPIASNATTSATGHTPSLTSLTQDVCTIAGLTIVPVAPGYCSVRATSAGDSGYSAASPVTRGFTIEKAVQTITFAQPTGSTLATGSRTVNPTTDAPGLTPTLASSTPAVCTVSGFAVTYVSAGLCTLTSTEPGTATYAPAADVTRSFVILDITTSALDGGQVGAAHSQTLAVAGGSGGGVWSTPDTLPSGITLDPSTGAFGGTPSATYSGSITVVYTEGGASVSKVLPYEVVAAAAPNPQTITFAQPDSHPIVDAGVTLAPTTDAVGLVPDLASSTPAVCTVSAFDVTFVATGLCTLTASQAGDATHSAAPEVSRSFQVFEITTTGIAAGTSGSSYSETLAVTGSAGTGVWSTTVALPAGLTLDPATGILAGTPTVGFDQDVPLTYTENGGAETVTLRLVVVVPPTPQAILFVNPGTQWLGSGSITVAPSADSGLTPTLTPSAPAVCTVTGVTITLVTTGLCTITASQPGDATHSAAVDVQRTFRIMDVTTASLASGRVGDGYTTGQTLVGAVGGGSWHTASALAGLTLDPATGVLSGTPTSSGAFSVVIEYTEDGATASKSLVLVVVPATVAAAPAPEVTPGPTAPPLVRNQGAPAAPAAPAVTATPKPTASPTATPTAKPAATPGNTTADDLVGFGKNSKAQVEVIGAKTVATLVVAADKSIDTTGIADAVREATGDGSGEFAHLVSATSVQRPSTVKKVALVNDDASYFTLTTLGQATVLSDINTEAASGWMHFAVDITGYKPGSTAYLAMTSSPVVFASSIVGKDGTARIEGDMALDVLPAGVHRLRVIGDRVVGAVATDATGAIILTAAQLAEIERFDQGTDAAVRASGDNATGGDHVAVRIVPLEQQVPWWLVWMLAGLALLLVAARLAAIAERAAGRWIKRTVLVLAALVPIGVGLILDEPMLSIVAAAVALVALVFTRVVPVARQRAVESYDYAPRFDTSSAWQN